MTESNVSLLIICGPSGSGKSVLEKSLTTQIHTLASNRKNIIFKKLMQVTTREPRLDESFGNPYIFLNDELFEKNKDSLIGRVGIKEYSIFTHKYGTIIESNLTPSVIYTAIFAEEAIEDFIENSGETFNTFVLGLNGNDNFLLNSKRENRDIVFLNKERTVLNLAHLVLTNSKPNFLNSTDVVNIIDTLRPNFFNK